MFLSLTNNFVRAFLAHHGISWFLVGLVLFFVLSSIDLSSYRDHGHKAAPTRVSGEQSFLSDVTIIASPKKEAWLIDMIDQAQKDIRIAVYTFTLPSLREALLRAHDRGVTVRLILEKNPYNATHINRDTRDFLELHGIEYRLSDEQQFAFMHAKYMVIDDRWIIETANWTRSSFVTNREFFLIGQDSSIRSGLIELFDADYDGRIGGMSDIRVLAGPTNARDRLALFVNQNTSRTPIKIYAPSFSDKALISLLDTVCQAGTPVSILLAYYPDQEEKTVYPPCLSVRAMRHHTLHAKGILIGDRAFVGSFNFTQNSLDNNRELGLFLVGESVDFLQKTFQYDWGRAVAF